MAFPSASVLDDFNRANEGPPPSANWTTDFDGSGAAGLKVVSNQCAPNGTGACSGYWNAATFGPDCECYVTVATVGASTNVLHLYARLASVGTAGVDGYSVQLAKAAGTDTLKLYRLDNGVHTQLGATVSQEFASGDSLGMDVTGTTVQLWYKSGAGAWTSLATRTDATYSAGGNLAVLTTGSTTWRLDNFGGGTVVTTTRGMPFGGRGTAFNGGRCLTGVIR